MLFLKFIFNINILKHLKIKNIQIKKKQFKSTKIMHLIKYDCLYYLLVKLDAYLSNQCKSFTYNRRDSIEETSCAEAVKKKSGKLCRCKKMGCTLCTELALVPLTALQVKSKALKKYISIKIIVVSYYIKIQINSFKTNKLSFISIINYFIGRQRIFISSV